MDADPCKSEHWLEFKRYRDAIDADGLTKNCAALILYQLDSEGHREAEQAHLPAQRQTFGIARACVMTWGLVVAISRREGPGVARAVTGEMLRVLCEWKRYDTERTALVWRAVSEALVDYYRDGRPSPAPSLGPWVDVVLRLNGAGLDLARPADPHRDMALCLQVTIEAERADNFVESLLGPPQSPASRSGTMRNRRGCLTVLVLFVLGALGLARLVA